MKYLTYIVIAVSMLALGGCKPASHPRYVPELGVHCLNGVNYYVGTEQLGYAGYGYLAPAYNPDGTLWLCNR